MPLFWVAARRRFVIDVSGHCISPTFKGEDAFLDILTFEDGTSMLSQNSDGPAYVVQEPRRAKISTTW